MALTPSSASTWTMISAPLMAWPARGWATGFVWSAASVIAKAYQFSQSPQNSVILPRGQPQQRLAVAVPHATHHRYSAAERGGCAGARRRYVFQPRLQNRIRIGGGDRLPHGLAPY